MTYDEDTLNSSVTMPGNEARRPNSGKREVELILGRYKVLSELGRGGMGVVYRCFDNIGHIEVAVKGLPPEVSHNKMEMEDIQDNYKLVSGLRHQNITGIRQLEEDPQTGDYYMVMDLAEGDNLRRWVKKHTGPEFQEQKLSIIDEVASALDYAHSQRIMHRDIKPENVIIDSDGHAHVLDFGLASQIRSSMSRVSMMMTSTSGTPTYKSPEQWQGRPQNARTDQYALGVMAYEMIAGYPPFDSEDLSILRMSVLQDKLPQIPDVPAHVNAALVRALAKDPSERFECCQDFVIALNGGKVPKGRRAARSHGSAAKRFLVTAMAVLAVGVGGYVGYVTYDRHQQELARQRMVLRRQAELLESRAEQARESVGTLGFRDMPELADVCKRLEGFFRAGEKAMKSGDYVSATNNFESVGACKRMMVVEERKIRVARLLEKGYVRTVDAQGLEDAVWKPGAPHPKTGDLVADTRAECWKSVRSGYTWNGSDGVTWREGLAHDGKPHWRSGCDEGQWKPEDGYVLKEKDASPLSELVWSPGLEFGDRRTSDKEGSWETRVSCTECSSSGKRTVEITCPQCNGSCSVGGSETCGFCSGKGSTDGLELCRGCNGLGTIRQDCSAGCSQITRSGRVLFQHGFVCSNCSGSGTVANTAGMVGDIAGAAIGAAIFGSSYRPASSAPARITCSTCGGLGGYQCGTCSGLGYSQVRCSACSGTGRVRQSNRCTACGGTGKKSVVLRCVSCANGKVKETHVCPACGGAGQVWKGEDGVTHRIDEKALQTVETRLMGHWSSSYSQSVRNSSGGETVQAVGESIHFKEGGGLSRSLTIDGKTREFSGTWEWTGDSLVMDFTDAAGKRMRFAYALKWESENRFEMRFEDLRAYEQTIGAGGGCRAQAEYSADGTLTTKIETSAANGQVSAVTVVQRTKVFGKE